MYKLSTQSKMDIETIQDQDFIIQYLTDHPDEVCIVDEHENSILQVYAGNSFNKLQSFLIEKFPEIIYSTNCFGRTALFDAIEVGNKFLVEKIIEYWPEAMWSEDEGGVYPLEFEIEFFKKNDGMLDLMLSYVNVDIDFESVFEIFMKSCVNFSKALSVLNRFPEIYDRIDDHGMSTLHHVSSNVFPQQMKLITHIHSMRPDLLMLKDNTGKTPAHLTSRYEYLSLFVKLCPECITVRDNENKTPLHHLKAFNTPLSGSKSHPCDELSFIRNMSELLFLQDNEGKTFPMILTYSSFAYEVFPMIIQLAPESLLIQDNIGRTCLRYCVQYKRSCWEVISRFMISCKPELIHICDNSGTSPMEIAYRPYGTYNTFVSRERFFATCLQYTSIPDSYWNVFSAPSAHLCANFMAILERSREDGKRAFEYLPKRDREKIIEILYVSKTLPESIVNKVLSRVY